MPILDLHSGNTIIPHAPTRIVSLVPSQTELLYRLGLTEQVIGITKFCVHPKEWHQNKIRIGGTKTLNIEKIKTLQPDLILANKEENVREQVEELAKDFPVWVSDVTNLEEALQMIADVGTLVQKETGAQTLVQKIESAFAQRQTTNEKPRTAYLIWKDPFMTIGGDTFIHDMMAKAGFENVFANKQRYPVVSINDLRTVNCQLLLLSSEPYPFTQKHVGELQPHLSGTKILLADGEMFSWYGSRLLKAPAYFQNLHERLRPL